MSIKDTIKLAKQFGEKMQEATTAQEMRDIIDRNKCAPDGICHSHDFLDANMVMDAAFRAHVGRGMAADSEADVKLWNDAWDIAVAADFFI